MSNPTQAGAVYRARSADRHLTLRYVSGIGTMLMALVMLVPISLLLFPVEHQQVQTRQVQQVQAAEDAYVARMAQILDVPQVDRQASLAGGYNACHWIDEYGLDPETLAGWNRYWSQPWERQWLLTAVTYLCPPAEGAGS